MLEALPGTLFAYIVHTGLCANMVKMALFLNGLICLIAILSGPYYQALNPIIIALNKRNKGNFKYDPPIKVTDEGIPICKGGFKMANWGPDPERRRHK